VDLYEKISILGPSAQYDTCGPKDFGKTTDIPGVYHAKVDGAHVCRLFKVLQSNKCLNNCGYCAFQRSHNIKRADTTPEEMAKAFYSAYGRRLVDGFFLSSAIDSHPDSTMTKMLDTAHILRDKYRYKGYMHLKIMPGSSSNTIREAMKLANRISLNMESPVYNPNTVTSPLKRLKTSLFPTLHTIRKEIEKARIGIDWNRRTVPSLTTQFVVGAGDEKDFDFIKMTNILYRKFSMKRVFFSAFRPVPGTPLENRPASSLTREHRLYQTYFLMRFYNFTPADIPLDDDGNLIETTDPKMLWAQMHPEYYPVNINQANYYSLLKIPGVGPTSARKIMQIRKISPIKQLDVLRGCRIQLEKMLNFACW